MKLHPGLFERVQSGKKTWEIRLNDEKRQAIQVGDFIQFLKRPGLRETVLAEVTELRTYKNFTELYHGVKEFFPEWNEKKFVGGMYEFYTKAQERRHGALAIGFKVMSENIHA